jgi:hypothetical protein
MSFTSHPIKKGRISMEIENWNLIYVLFCYMIKQIYQNDLTPIYLVLRQNPLKEKGIE